MTVLIKSKNTRNLGIFIEVFHIIKRARTLLLLFCEAFYVKARQMDETGVNMINMTGNINDKLRKRKVENSVKINKKMN